MGILAVVVGAVLFLVVGVLFVKLLVWVSDTIDKVRGRAKEPRGPHEDSV